MEAFSSVMLARLEEETDFPSLPRPAQANYDIHTIQRLLGQSDAKTTMIFIQTVLSVTPKEAKSPLDLNSGAATGKS